MKQGCLSTIDFPQASGSASFAYTDDMSSIQAPDSLNLRVCVLDFDGVLMDDAVFFSAERGMYLATPGRVLFEWMPILEELLEPYPDLRIVLSTTWVRAKGLAYATSRLSPSLRSRVIGATFDNRLIQKAEFDMMPRGLQVWRDIERRAPAAWFAIDNDAAGWPEHCLERVVLTQDRLGLSDIRVQEAVRHILASMHDAGAPS